MELDAEGQEEHEEERQRQQHVDEVREDGDQREHLRREQDPLDQGARRDDHAGGVGERGREPEPGQEPGEEEDRVPLHRHPEVDGEHEGVHQHQEQRVQERPEEAEEGAAVPRAELPQDQRPDQRAVPVQMVEVSRPCRSTRPPGPPVSSAGASRPARPRGSAGAGSRSPTGERPEPARVADQHGHVDRANALRRPAAPRSGAGPARGTRR